MLRKLMKHEWIATRRILLPLNLTMLLDTLVACIFLCTDFLQDENSLPLAALLLFLYVLSLLALSAASKIYLIVRFYRNLFSSEGYLMFTLPVTPAQLFNSKLLAGCGWCFLNTLLMVFSLFALGFSSGYYSAMHGDSNSKGAMLSDLVSSVSGGAQNAASFQDIFGYTPLILVILCLIMLIVASFSALTMGYLAIMLGQLIEKYKLACSICFYIALYIGTQIISSIVMVAANIHIISDSSESLMVLTRNIYHTILPLSTAVSLILGIVFYLITLTLIRKKVNLD